MSPVICRDRSGFHSRGVFKLITCSMCYIFIFPRLNILEREFENKMTIIKDNYTAEPDIENETVIARFCSAFDNEEQCGRWKSCCKGALQCCEEQQKDVNISQDDRPTCPPTWDGFSCWKRTPEKTRVFNECPEYVHEFEVSDGKAHKYCEANGTWWMFPKTDQEWSNYSTCIQLQKRWTTLCLGISSSVISILLLIPATLVFLYFRPLRIQQRIRIHICLFLSLILTAFSHFLWDILIFYNQFRNKGGNSNLSRNTVGCRFLYFITRYCRNTNFSCMFIEGFYLYRLLTATFKQPKRLIGYYLFVWVFPLVPALIYATIRGTMFNKLCWSNDIGRYEWVLYTPNLLCLIGNLIFFIYILMVLITQLQTHPNEPSSYRRALKATFVLIPLFGLQLVFIINRPDSSSSYVYTYENISEIIIKSQGAFVALIFCFFNGEVSIFFF
ncbi:calcitonin receptor [Octopus bimaculoides]|nr:calcitonin receptor [Octopus bimaculoides]